MYIRTKDGVYDTSKGLYTSSIKMWAIDAVTIYDDQIIRKSENLEELCDEFVGLVKSKSNDFVIMRVMAHSLKELKESLKTELNGKIYQSHYDIVYGAIWCSKGLIYVAKMNDKGELELIWE